MTAVTDPRRADARSAPTRKPVAAARVAFRALLLRDLVVLRKTLKEFIPRTILQPFLLVFVFTYVFPKIGQGVGGTERGEPSFSTLLVAGVVGLAIMFQGIQSVALPMVQEFGYTREIEDRVLAPLPVVAGRDREGRLGRAAAGCSPRCSCSRSPRSCRPRRCTSTSTGWCCSRSRRSPATCAARSGSRSAPASTRAPCRCCSASSCIPLTFLGCVYYSWSSLEPIRWLQILVLVNPLVYMCEGFRAALTTAPHMSLWAIYPALHRVLRAVHLARDQRASSAAS